MAAAALRSEERIGLIVALAAHAALVALLLVQRPGAAVMPPDRIEVTISEDVGLTSTSPEPRAQAAPDVAPEIGDPPPPEPEPAPPAPRPEPPRPDPPKAAPPKPEPRPQPKAAPRKPAPRPAPKPEPRAAAQPQARPEPERPAPKAAAKPAARPAPKAAAKPREADRPTGGSRIGDDFLKGVPGARDDGPSRNPPAQAAGPQVQASLLGAISRALRPHWQGKAPEGADAEKLVTVLRWNLNRDGTLSGRPELVRQEGVTAANRPQAPRHAEQAIRAVQLAAPFDLPEEHYNTWKRVTIRFDKRLSQ